jgi:hypothetical protein
MAQSMGNWSWQSAFDRWLEAPYQEGWRTEKEEIEFWEAHDAEILSRVRMDGLPVGDEVWTVTEDDLKYDRKEVIAMLNGMFEGDDV